MKYFDQLFVKSYICFFQTTYFNLSSPRGGAEVIAVEIVKQFSSYYPIIVLYPYQNDSHEEKIVKHAENIHGVEAYEFDNNIYNSGVITPVFGHNASRLILNCKILFTLERVIKCNDIKRQITVLGGMFYPHCKQVAESNLFDYLIVPSDYLKDWCIEMGTDTNKILIIYNGIDTNFFYDTQMPTNQDQFFIAARSGYEKGFREAIEFVSKINEMTDKNYFITTCVESASSFASDIKKMADKQGVKIFFMGWRERYDMRDLYNESFCLLSLGEAPEGFGLSVIESIACGTPVLSQKIGFVKEMLPENTGIYFIDDVNMKAVDDINSLLLAISSKDVIVKARDYIIEHYTLERMKKEYESIMLKIINDSI